MKIEAVVEEDFGLDDLAPGTPFWSGDSLYMKLFQPEDKGPNVVSLTNGHLLKWRISNPRVAKVKIVNCE